MSTTLILFCFLIGCLVGLRSLTAPAVICWGAHLGWLNFAGTRLAFIGHRWMLVLFTLLALVELVNDKLPIAPARTAPPGLIARILFGGLCGAVLAVSAGGNLWVAVIVAVIGALVGTFGGYNIRHTLVTKSHLPDLGVALAEDAVAIAAASLSSPIFKPGCPDRGCRRHRNCSVRGTPWHKAQTKSHTTTRLFWDLGRRELPSRSHSPRRASAPL